MRPGYAWRGYRRTASRIVAEALGAQRPLRDADRLEVGEDGVALVARRHDGGDEELHHLAPDDVLLAGGPDSRSPPVRQDDARAEPRLAPRHTYLTFVEDLNGGAADADLSGWRSAAGQERASSPIGPPN